MNIRLPVKNSAADFNSRVLNTISCLRKRIWCIEPLSTTQFVTTANRCQKQRCMPYGRATSLIDMEPAKLSLVAPT